MKLNKVWEQGVEENICSRGEGSDREHEKITQKRASL
jgi:hypothetical protein